MPTNYAYATVAQVVAEVTNVTGTNMLAETPALLLAAQQATARIEDFVGFRFVPELRTEYLDRANWRRESGYYLGAMPLPCLSITSAAAPDATALVSGTDYQARPRSGTPKLSLAVTSDAFARSESTFDQWLNVTGVWGWAEGYATAWQTGSTLAANVASTTATSITVTSGTLFSPGALIKINAEYLAVTGVSTNTLTVTRAELGTTATTHTSADAVTIYAPDSDAMRACARWAAYLYYRRGRYENVVIDGVGSIVTLPQDTPPEVERWLTARKWSWTSGHIGTV